MSLLEAFFNIPNTQNCRKLWKSKVRCITKINKMLDLKWRSLTSWDQFFLKIEGQWVLTLWLASLTLWLASSEDKHVWHKSKPYISMSIQDTQHLPHCCILLWTMKEQSQATMPKKQQPRPKSCTLWLKTTLSLPNVQKGMENNTHNPNLSIII